MPPCNAMLPRSVAYNTPPLMVRIPRWIRTLIPDQNAFWAYVFHKSMSRYYIEYEEDVVEVSLHFSVFKLEMVGVIFLVLVAPR